MHIAAGRPAQIFRRLQSLDRCSSGMREVLYYLPAQQLPQFAKALLCKSCIPLIPQASLLDPWRIARHMPPPQSCFLYTASLEAHLCVLTAVVPLVTFHTTEHTHKPCSHRYLPLSFLQASICGRIARVCHLTDFCKKVATGLGHGLPSEVWGTASTEGHALGPSIHSIAHHALLQLLAAAGCCLYELQHMRVLSDRTSPVSYVASHPLLT